jgi:hypothetical protein
MLLVPMLNKKTDAGSEIRGIGIISVNASIL